jgi:hypothetical protein
MMQPGWYPGPTIAFHPASLLMAWSALLVVVRLQRSGRIGPTRCLKVYFPSQLSFGFSRVRTRNLRVWWALTEERNSVLRLRTASTKICCYLSENILRSYVSLLPSSLSEMFSEGRVRGRVINFWDISPCSPLSVNRRFGGTYRLHLQSRRNNFSKQAAYHLLACWFLAELISSILKMEAICFSET